MYKLNSLIVDGKNATGLKIDGKPVAFNTLSNPNYLCFENVGTYAYIYFPPYEGEEMIYLQYSYDMVNWIDLNLTVWDTIELLVGQKAYIKAKTSNKTISTENYTYQISHDGTLRASGNVNSLLESDPIKAKTVEIPPYCYRSLFYSNTTIGGFELPSTILGEGCYDQMFEHCEQLEKIKVGFTSWDDYHSTQNWLRYTGSQSESTPVFECPWELLINTSIRSDSTVPNYWSMVAV